MRQFYEVTQKLKDTLISDDDVNVVTLGDTSDYDLDKQTVYPLAHIIPGNVALNGSTVGMDFTIVFMDRPYTSKGDKRDVADPFHGVDDLQDVWNTQMQVANRLTQRMQRGDLFSDLYQLDGTPSVEPFMDRGENVLAGWVLNFTVLAPNNDMCITTSSTTVLAPSNLSAAVGGVAISLTWTDNATNETGYYVLRSTNPLTGYETLATLGADASAYTDTSVTTDTFYHYKVRAFNTEAVSGFSNIATQYISSGGGVDVTLGDGGSVIDNFADGGFITVLDQNANDITTDYASTDGSANVTVTIYNTALPMKTGRTVSENANDDGDLERGRLSNFTTLGFNNPFGNTNRFTDTAGGQTFANAIAIDWGSWSQADEQVLGYAFENLSKVAWAAAITAAEATSIGSFTSGWHLPNVNEAIALCNLGASVNVYNYSPINGLLNAAQDHWTSTPIINNSNGAYCIRAGQLYVATVNKTSFTAYWFAVRTFTLTELGL